jgi:curli biogenesis system outer membrane secretion channel CsgG
MSIFNPHHFCPAFVRLFNLLVGFIFLVCLPTACAPTARIIGGGPGLDTIQLMPYDGPKARVAVASFDDKTGGGYHLIGEGMSDMFVTALVNSGRFIVLERDLIDEVIREQDLAAGRRVKIGTGASSREIEGAEILVIGAVTEFEPEKMGIAGGIVGLGTLITTALLHEQNSHIPIAAAGFTESHVAIDVRLVDAATSRIIAAVSVEGSGQDWGGGVIGEVGGGMTRVPLVFGGFRHTATEKAVRKTIDMSVAAITFQAPPQYFHFADEDHGEGRIFGFAYLDLSGISGEDFPAPEVRKAASQEEWQALAGRLGLPKEASPPVDLSTRQVIAIAAGTQAKAGMTLSVERVVVMPESLEITAILAPPPPADGESPAAAGLSQQPLILIHTARSDLPLKVIWGSPGDGER